MRPQYRLVDVREPGQVLRLRRPGQQPKVMKFWLGPGRAFPAYAAEQRRIGGHVVAGERRDLVDDFVRAQMWIPHSVLAVPAQRPLRGSAPSATRAVQVRHPIDG